MIRRTRIFTAVVCIIFCTLLLAPSCPPTLPADYYVGPAPCSDTDPDYGADITMPFCTFEKALDSVAQGQGATIQALEGTYNEQVRIIKSGSPTKPLVIEPVPGNAVIINGTGLNGCWDETYWHGIVGVYSASHVTLRRLTIRNARDHRYREPVQPGIDPIGFGVEVSESDNISLELNTVTTTDHGGIVVSGSSAVRVISNEVTATNLLEEDGIAGAVHEALTISGCADFIVEYNYVHDVFEEGIDVKDASSGGEVRYNAVAYTGAVGIYINSANSVDVFGNWVHDAGNYRSPAGDAGDGIALATGDGTSGYQVNYNRIFRNQIWYSSRQGLSIYNKSASTTEIIGNQFFNNTVYYSGWSTNGGYSLYFDAEDIAFDNEFFNNIFSTSNAWKDEVRGDLSGNSGYNNLFYNTYDPDHLLLADLDPWYPSGSIMAVPEFQNPAIGDFSLKPGSAAIDAGACSAGQIYYDLTVDIGANEHDDSAESAFCP